VRGSLPGGSVTDEYDTRLTNGFSKKAVNLYYSVALHSMRYNFARLHETLRVTPAMEAGIAGHVWTIDEIVRLSN
jgi:hypothetical protein